MDNLYGNVKLAEFLLSLKIECTTTMRKDRVPKALKFSGSPSSNDFVSLSRNGVTVLKWMDKKEVTFCTTAKAHSPLALVTTMRRRAVVDPVTHVLKRQMAEITVLNVAKDYNYNMNGVDIQDQMRTVFNIKLRKRKWWFSIWFFLLETCICNAYIAYKHFMLFIENVAPEDLMTHVEFRLQLAHKLSPMRRKRKVMQTQVLSNHYPSKVDKNDHGS